MARKRNTGRKGRAHAQTRAQGASEQPGSPWIYGVHAVLAALGNPARTCERLLVADDETAQAATIAAGALDRYSLIERVGRDDISAFLPAGAVHQNIALLARPLPEQSLDDICAAAGPEDCLLVLDQVTDPHNVGAIIRSAAAFGVRVVIMQDRHAPPVTGVVAKAASGGLEHVAMVYETNLARTLDSLKKDGFWCIGLAGEAETELSAARIPGRKVLVLGAEGPGMRRLVRESCDALARIPQSGAVQSLNVSNAAAVALYELTRPGPSDGS